MTMPQNIAFRNTLGYVTDEANTYAELFAGFLDNYPVVTPQGNNVGWDLLTNELFSQDGVAANDPRIAGASWGDNLGARYRIDLPATGMYPIGVACGHPLGASAVGLELRDGNLTSLGFLVSGSTSAAQRFKDITNTEYTQLTWPTSSLTVNYTFATTIARFALGQNESIAYISIGERVVGPVRAVVAYRDVAGIGGENPLKLIYTVTFFGDTIAEAVATQKQREIVVEIGNNFTFAERRDAIITAVQALATELDLTIAAIDVLSLGDFSPPSYVDINNSPGSFIVSDETYRQLGPHLKLTGSQRMTVQGTGRVSGSN